MYNLPIPGALNEKTWPYTKKIMSNMTAFLAHSKFADFCLQNCIWNLNVSEGFMVDKKSKLLVQQGSNSL